MTGLLRLALWCCLQVMSQSEMDGYRVAKAQEVKDDPVTEGELPAAHLAVAKLLSLP